MATTRLEELFDRFRRGGDLDALAEVFDRTSEQLLRVARHLSNDEAQAEDLVQATFLTAIERGEGFDSSRELLPWLTGILTNKAKLARALSTRTPDPDRLAERASEDPALDAELREFLATIERALERVPDAYRQVLRIHLGEGKGPQEIARELDRPAGRVRVQLHRGLKWLRRALPAGFALGAIGAVAAPRGLAAMRAEFLRNAGSLVKAGAAGTSAAAVTGGFVVANTVAVGAGVVLVAAVATWMAWRPRQAVPELSRERAPALSLAEDTGPRETNLDGHAASDASQRSVASTPESAPTDAYGALDMEWTWADGTPAVGVGIGAGSVDGRRFERIRYAWTDGRGRLSLERLPEGRIAVQPACQCLSKYFEAVVERGRRTQGKFSIREGIDVGGRAVDGDGRPVSGADVWIRTDNDDGGVHAARTGSDGGFIVRALDPSCSLFATADGLGMSHAVRIRDLDPKSSRLDLQIEGPSATLRGIVRGPDGTPVEDAWVTLRCLGRPHDWPTLWMTTGPDGSFVFAGTRTGPNDLEVEAPGCALAARLIQLEEGSNPAMEVRLEIGITVHGTVRGVDQASTSRARIRWARPDDPRSFYRPHSFTRSDESGRFRLEHVPSGDVELLAELRGPESVRRASTKIAGKSGETLTWDPVFSETLTITGRVVDEARRPLEGWRVEVATQARLDNLPTSTKSGPDGRFVLSDCVAVPYTVVAYRPTRSRIGGAKLEGVMGGTHDVELTVVDADVADGSVVGRIVNSRGDPIGGASVSVVHKAMRQGISATTDAKDGSFRLGPLPPGRYGFHAKPEGLPSYLALDSVEVLASEVHDLGTIQLQPLGRVEVLVRGENDSDARADAVWLMEGIYGHPLRISEDARWRSEELYAGSYVLRASGGRIATEQRSVEIRPEETVSLEIAVRPGATQLVWFPVPEGSAPPQRLPVVVRRADGSPCLDLEASWGRESAESQALVRNLSAGFVPGSYTFEARSPDGWFATGSFVIESATAVTKPIVAPLRRL